jgi:hypothetical protein
LTEYPGTENGKGELQNVYRVGISCDRVSRKILIAGLSLGDWASAPKKKMAAVWAGHKKNKTNFSLSARVLQRKPTRQPAQKKAVILHASKRVQYDPESKYT